MPNSPKEGILPYQDLKRLIHEGIVTADYPLDASQIQPASLDLRLGPKAYRLLGSFLPEDSDIGSHLEMHDLYDAGLVMYEIDLSCPEGAILEKGHVYLVPLLERLCLPSNLHGRTNPKSSTGRLDIFTRVITDLNLGFDKIHHGYKGPMYLEIVPRSFTVRVKSGMALNQLRLVKGTATLTDEEIVKLHKETPLLNDPEADPINYRIKDEKKLHVDHGLFLSVNLKRTAEGYGPNVGYRAKKNSHVIELAKVGYYRDTDFWEPIPENLNSTLLLEPEEFYILASKERIRVPPGYAAEMVAYEAGCGELRTHYAGFFDPGFGNGRGELQGTRVVLEVRPHDVPFLIRHGQTFFKVVYEKMSNAPDQVYGAALGSHYHEQGLTLSKHFKS